MMKASPIPSLHLRPFPADIKTPLVDVQPKSAVTLEEVVPEPTILTELTSVERLIVTKRLHIKNAIFMRGKKNRFFIRTPDQNLVYTAEEETNWWIGYLCYGLRPLQLRVTNGQGVEVMRINRPYACTSRVLPCQLQNLEVYSPPGHLIGRVQQQWTAMKPLYLVLNDQEDPVFWIRGPYITLNFFRDVQFEIQRIDGTHVGATNKRWHGLAHALFFAPVSDRFGVAFDKDLSVQEKALLLAVSILLDYMYYDS